MHKFDYRWTLADAHFTKDKGTVFSCFACGGGSSMGFGKSGMFNNQYVYPDKVSPTLAARKDCLIRFDIPKYLSASEVCCISSFPQDYEFGGQIPHYVCGMSVPPVMMAQVASRIYDQWLSKIRK